ncbi:MAG: hypothetical protein HZB56_01970 [Deltaproteobacteria bacterium]|nr:hypothetical protein [Deltaproteobacteria bacterium]
MIGPLLLAAALLAPGAEVARAEPSKGAVRLGEPFDYAVALRHAAGEEVALAPLPDLGPFSALSHACQTAAEAGAALTVCTLRLQLLDLGEHAVPELGLLVKGPEGERRVPVPGARITGSGTLDPQKPAAGVALHAPPAPPVKVPTWRPVLLGAAAVAALLAAWLLWRWWRRRPRGQAAPPLTPQERFERQLADLAAADLPARGRRREHVARAADAVREYLSDLAPQAALDLTSDELLVALVARPVAGVENGPLRVFLSGADLVKFARHDPSGEECAAALAFGRELLARTRPPPAAGGRAA